VEARRPNNFGGTDGEKPSEARLTCDAEKEGKTSFGKLRWNITRLPLPSDANRYFSFSLRTLSSLFYLTHPAAARTRNIQRRRRPTRRRAAVPHLLGSPTPAGATPRHTEVRRFISYTRWRSSPRSRTTRRRRRSGAMRIVSRIWPCATTAA
jgi:hypothetical protein